MTTGDARGGSGQGLARRVAGAGCAAVLTVLLAGCSAGRPAADDADIEPASLGALGIPLNAVPGPGKCRIWRPGNSASRQMGPGTCRRLAPRVDTGGWLLRHPAPPEDGPDRVHLVVYGEEGPSLVRIFELESGKLVRERRPE